MSNFFISDEYDYEGRRPVSYVLPIIVLNVVIFIFCSMGGRYVEPSVRLDNSLTELLKFHPYYISKLQLWRFVTYLFVHGSFSHLLFNMWGLYMFGTYLERALGGTRFLILYLVSGIIGGLCWMLFNYSSSFYVMFENGASHYLCRSMSDVRELLSAYPAAHQLGTFGGLIGASGAVFGVMVATAMAFPNMMVVLLFPPIPMRLKNMIWIYMLIEVVELFASSDNIAHLAHLGGALGGFLFINYLNHRDGYR